MFSTHFALTASTHRYVCKCVLHYFRVTLVAFTLLSKMHPRDQNIKCWHCTVLQTTDTLNLCVSYTSHKRIFVTQVRHLAIFNKKPLHFPSPNPQHAQRCHCMDIKTCKVATRRTEDTKYLWFAGKDIVNIDPDDWVGKTLH